MASQRSPEEWIEFIRMLESQADGNTQDLTRGFDELLLIYPNAIHAQLRYLSHFSKPEHGHIVESIFTRFLPSSPYVDLWKAYVRYVLQKHEALNGSAVSNAVGKALRFAVEWIGHDQDAGEIWVEYIGYAQRLKPTGEKEQEKWAENVRKIFQQALRHPLNSIDQLWRHYVEFEHSCSKHSPSVGVTEDIKTVYRRSRLALTRLEMYQKKIDKAPCTDTGDIWLPRQRRSSVSDVAQINAWQEYLRWEESNPLEIVDRRELNIRIRTSYAKALAQMRFHPEMWYLACQWAFKDGSGVYAMELLKEGVVANPSSFLLNLTYAEELEKRLDYEDSHKVYRNLIKSIRSNVERQEELQARAAADLDGGASTYVSNLNEKEGSAKLDVDSPSSHRTLSRNSREYSFAWIMYMRFVRRSQGIEASRDVFSQACVGNFCSWEMYEAAAVTEYFGTGDTHAATSIFQQGLIRFGSDPEYVLRCLNFMVSVNHVSDASALMNLTAERIPASEAQHIWDVWARFQHFHSPLNEALENCKPMGKLYPNFSHLKWCSLRFSYGDMDAMSIQDLCITSSTPSQCSLPTVPGAETTSDKTAPLDEPLTHRKSPSMSQETHGLMYEPSQRDFPDNLRASDDASRGGQRNLALKTSDPPAPSIGRDAKRKKITDTRNITLRGIGPSEHKITRPYVTYPLRSLLRVLPLPTQYDGPVFDVEELLHIFSHLENLPCPTVSR